MKKKPDLPALLKKHDALPRAVDTLIECLGATRSFSTGGTIKTEPDHATRAKASQTLLAYAVGEPVKRQQILHGAMPEKPVDSSELRDTITRKIAARVNAPDVTVAELVAAGKSLAEAEKDAPLTPLSEQEAVAEARRIHGMV